MFRFIKTAASIVGVALIAGSAMNADASQGLLANIKNNARELLSSSNYQSQGKGAGQSSMQAGSGHNMSQGPFNTSNSSITQNPGNNNAVNQNIQISNSGLGKIQPGSPFSDNGKINDSMPKPTGSTENPQIDSQIMEETQQLGELTQSEDYNYVSILGNVSDSEYEDFCSYLETVVETDPQVMSAFEEDDWEIILTTADLDDLLFQGQTDGVEGCTYFNQKTIYVHAGQYSYCVVHEIGHYIDYKCNFASKTSDFAEIFSSESANLTEYGQTSSTEFFAEVYEYLLLQPETLKSNCSEAASYVEACADSL
ncbi:MAG: hypothetical protein K6A23_13020 [Butyrivibrio sp.]|nr:hypothetical protein [Butyrivibrio sp.]